jgi:predicted GIY-YIG superfamily endonuclease
MMQANGRCAVYILASRCNGAPYVGVTNNIAARAYQHRTGAGGEFTCKYGMTRATAKRAWLRRRAKARQHELLLHMQKSIKAA